MWLYCGGRRLKSALKLKITEKNNIGIFITQEASDFDTDIETHTPGRAILKHWRRRGNTTQLKNSHVVAG